MIKNDCTVSIFTLAIFLCCMVTVQYLNLRFVLTYLLKGSYNICMKNVNISEEEYVELLDDLLSAFSKETEQSLPDNLTIKQKRWLLDALLEVRSLGDLDKDLLQMQDKLLSYEANKRGVNDIARFKFNKGVANFECGLETINADVCVFIGCSLIPSIDQQLETEKQIMSCAGIQLKEDFGVILNQNHNVISKTNIYVADGYNLPCKKVVKILVNFQNSQTDYASFLTAVKELFLFLKQNNFKSVAIDLKTLKNYDFVMAEIFKREIKNNKKIKILINC